jgi:hypothetical protein
MIIFCLLRKNQYFLHDIHPSSLKPLAYEKGIRAVFEPLWLALGIHWDSENRLRVFQSNITGKAFRGLSRRLQFGKVLKFVGS